jgi:predicted Na+-dependent transporter
MDVVRRIAGGYPELVAVVCAAVIGLTVQVPLRWLVAHQGINILLVLLIFATAVTITLGDIADVAHIGGRLAVSLLAAITVLPGLAWLVARIVASGPLRDGVLTIGLAPCEIASVATTTMAGGQAAAAAALLIGSTVLSVAVAGPLLILETGHASFSPAHLAVNLAMVVILPLAVGITLRTTRGLGEDQRRLTGPATTITLAALVALIASEVHLSTEYVGVLCASILLVIASASVGQLLSRGANDDIAIPILLTTSMRDFAIAAGIATSAFGAAAAAPLGLYGIIVLVWGTTVAGALRQRSASGV